MELHEAKTRFNKEIGTYSLDVWFTETRENKDFPKTKQTWNNLATEQEAIELLSKIFDEYGPDHPYADQPLYDNYWDKEPSAYIRGWDGGSPLYESGNEVIIDGFIYYRVRPAGRYSLWVKWNHYARKYVDVTDQERETIKKAGGLPDING